MCQPLRQFVVIVFCQLSLMVCEAGAQQTPNEPGTKEFDWAAFESLTTDKLAKMPLDDPVLRAAYAQIFLRSGEPSEWMLAVRSDLLRRGNEATPLLLSLFKENPESEFRADLMGTVEMFRRTIDLEPFLNAARSLFQNEGLNLPPRTCYQMAWLFERHGKASDLRILEQLRYHPVKEVGFVIKPNIERMTKRLAQESASEQAQARSPTAPSTATPSPATPVPVPTPKASPQPAARGAQAAAAPIEERPPVWPWLVGMLVLVVIVAVALNRRA